MKKTISNKQTESNFPSLTKFCVSGRK